MTIRLIAGCFLLASLFATGCQSMRELKTDLDSLVHEIVIVRVEINNKTDSDAPVVVVAMATADGSQIIDRKTVISDDYVDFRLVRRATWLFAFVDNNGDSVFQPNEPYGWFNASRPLTFAAEKSRNVEIDIVDLNAEFIPPPRYLVDERFEDQTRLGFVNLGTVVQLEDELFSMENANKGMWQPYTFVLDDLAGMFFLEPFDANRIPVIMIHGLTGSPQQFETIVESLDNTRFQVWMFNYPSGWNLDDLSASLFQILNTLHSRHEFEGVHVIAHSMGGLIAREFLNRCVEFGSCDYLMSFTSISTPFAGVQSAAMGVEYAPEDMQIPVWESLRPDSSFIAELFRKPVPEPISCQLVFTFKKDGSVMDLVANKSSDGVIPLSSQLRPEAQNQACRLRGFDNTHVGVLSDPALIDAIKEELNRD